MLGGEKVVGILNVAGGWAGGNTQDADWVKNADLMWKQSGTIVDDNQKRRGFVNSRFSAFAFNKITFSRSWETSIFVFWK